MSGLSVPSDNAMFTEEAADSALTPAVQPTELVADSDSPLADVETQLDVDDSGIGDEIDALDVPEGEQEPPTDEPAPETPEPVDEAGMAAFSAQFEKYTGVPLKDAMKSYQETAQAASAAQAELQSLYQQVSIQQQRLDLQTSWASDPEIQQQVQSGMPLSAAVDTRLERLRTVYESLGEARQKRIDALGSKGVLELWKIVNKRPNRSLPGVGALPSGDASNSDLMKLSEIQAMSESDYRTKGMQLLKERKFINDLGI
jgi:hypothetical protein